MNRLVNISLDDYRIKIANLGSKLNLFTCEELKSYLSGKNKEIDFVNEYIDELKAVGKNKTAANFNTIKNSLTDFFRRKQILITEIEVDMLGDWSFGKAWVTKLCKREMEMAIFKIKLASP